MRTPSLIFSVVVHGGAIGAVVTAASFAAASTHVAAKVEVQASEARWSAAFAPSGAPVPDAELPVVAEPYVSVADLPPDPDLAEPLEEPAQVAEPVLEPGESPLGPSDLQWLTRIRPQVVAPPVAAPPAANSAAAIPPVIEPPPAPAEPPAPASVHVAASPRSDNQPPYYPTSERALGHEGTVVVAVTVDVHGLVVEVALTEPSAHPALNRAAMAAARRWRFEPSTIDGVRVEDTVRVPFEFRLRDGG